MSFNILFTSVGRRVSLINHFRDALAGLGLEGVLVGVDVSRTAPAVHSVDRSYLVPAVESPDYVAELLDVCQKETISLVVPLIDPDLPVLSQHRAEFKDVGATALVSDPATIEIAMDKRKTHDFFVENGFETPRMHAIPDGSARTDSLPYPLILKPRRGSASIGIAKVVDRRELEFYRDQIVDPVLQEYLTGDEFTLDILVDFQGHTRCVVPRKRLEVRTGEVSKAVTVRDTHIIQVGERVAEALPGALGPITVQGFLTEDRCFKLVEINPRFGGGHPLAIRAGANFPLWIVEMVTGAPSSVDAAAWEDGLLMLRYDEAVFVEGQSGL